MARKFNELRAKLSPARQAKNAQAAQKLLDKEVLLLSRKHIELLIANPYSDPGFPMDPTPTWPCPHCGQTIGVTSQGVQTLFDNYLCCSVKCGQLYSETADYARGALSDAQEELASAKLDLAEAQAEVTRLEVAVREWEAKLRVREDK